VLVIVAVRIVASGAALLERGLMHMLLLALLRLLAVTAQANRNRVRFGEARRAAGVRIVAVGAIAGRAPDAAPSPSRSAQPCRRGR